MGIALDLPDLAVVFKRTLYANLVAEFAPLAAALAEGVGLPAKKRGKKHGCPKCLSVCPGRC